MNNNRKRTALCLLGATLCVFMAFGAALYFGRYPITLQALLAGDAMAVRTFTVLRLPRAVMALAGGFGLGVAGFVYQTVFRNPLASPDIIGVSSGASVGAAFAILFVSSGTLGTTVCAFAGGLAAVFLSLGLAAAAPGRSKMNLVLAGIAVHALAQTLLMLLKLTADPEKELASIEYWIMGSLAGVTQSRVWFPVPMVISCCAVIFALHRQAMLLSVEEDEARLLGVPVGRMRFLLLTLATLVVAAVVSVTGLISFVGFSFHANQLVLHAQRNQQAGGNVVAAGKGFGFFLNGNFAAQLVGNGQRVGNRRFGGRFFRCSSGFWGCGSLYGSSLAGCGTAGSSGAAAGCQCHSGGQQQGGHFGHFHVSYLSLKPIFRCVFQTTTEL